MAVIEIHMPLEGCGSEYIGDWRVEIDWGGQNPFKKGVQPKSIKMLEPLRDSRGEEADA